MAPAYTYAGSEQRSQWNSKQDASVSSSNYSKGNNEREQFMERSYTGPLCPNPGSYEGSYAGGESCTWEDENETYNSQYRSEQFQDEEAYWGHESHNVVDEIFDNRNGQAVPSKKKKSRTRKIILVVVVLFLGGMGGLVYWLFQITSSPLAESNATASETGEPTGGEGAKGATNPPGPQANEDGTNLQIGDSADSAQDVTGVDTESPAPSILPPPSSFNVTCSRESILEDQFNIFQCENVCREAACCYVRGNGIETAFDSCREAKEEVCALYSPLCNFFYGPFNIQLKPPNSTVNDTDISLIPPAPDNLLSLCGNGGSAKDCIDACYDGYCCYSSAIDIIAGANKTAPSCYDRDICEGYIPCILGILTSLLPASDPNELPRPPDDLPDLCSDDAFSTQAGAVTCLSHCSKALCCVDPDPSTSCIADNIDICASYSPCGRAILQDVTAVPEAEDVSDIENTAASTEFNSTLGADEPSGIPPPPEGLTEMCDPGYIESSQENLTACALSCEVALCCFGDGESCLQDQLAVCLAYFPCQVLLNFLGEGGGVPGPPADLTKNCGELSLTTQDGRVECLKGCFPGLCCFDPGDACFRTNLFSCLAYSPCETVVDLEDGGFKGIVPLVNSTKGNGTDVNIPLPPVNIDDLCSEENLSLQEGLIECFGVCSAAFCCTSDDDNCYASNTANCDLYEECLNLLFLPTPSPSNSPANSIDDSFEIQPPPDNLESICAGEAAFTSSDCRVICERAADCYNAVTSSLLDPSWCALFTPCLVYQNLEGPTKAPSNNTAILKACAVVGSGDSDGACEDLCLEGACCFLDPNEDAACSSNTNFCEYYLPCNVFYDEDTEEKFNATGNSTLLKDLCDPILVSNDTEAWQECAKACLDGECCYLDDDDKDSCLNRTDFCAEYSACHVLSAISPGNNTIFIEQECLPENGQSFNETNAACEWLCMEAMCCFIVDDDAGSCANETDFCKFFENCEIIFGRNDTLAIPSPSPSSLITPGNDTNPVVSEPPSQTLSGGEEPAPSASLVPTSENDTYSPSVSETPSLSPDIEDVCNVTNVAVNDGRQACIDICVAGGCCFLDTAIDLSCKDQVNFCAYYQPCASLFGANPTATLVTESPSSVAPSVTPLSNKTTGVLNSILDVACSADSVLTPAGLRECTGLCAEGSCCRVDGSSTETCRDQVAFCSYYVACSSVEPARADVAGDPEISMDPFEGPLIETPVDPVAKPLLWGGEDPQDVVDTPNLTLNGDSDIFMDPVEEPPIETPVDPLAEPLPVGGENPQDVVDTPNLT